MLGVCWEDDVDRMEYTIQLDLLFKLSESNLIQMIHCYTSVDVLIWPYPSAGQKLLWGLGAQTRGRGGTTEAPELAPWRKSDFTDLGFGLQIWGLDSRLLGINELGDPSSILLNSWNILFFHKFSFPLEFPQFSGWHYPPVSPQHEVLQQRSPVPWCLARPRREAPLPASRLGRGRCGAAASGVPTVGRGLWGGEGSSGWWFGTFIFPNSWDDDPIWLSYFSEGLKPPNSHGFAMVFSMVLLFLSKIDEMKNQHEQTLWCFFLFGFGKYHKLDEACRFVN